MSNTLIVALQRSLLHAHWASLRFNYRGVGRSEGTFDNGVGETDDALAALTFARREVPSEHAALIGWSYGSMIALRAAQTLRVPVVGIAPPVSARNAIAMPWIPETIDFPLLIIAGSEDPVGLPGDVEAFGHGLGAETFIVQGAGHFFAGQLAEVCRRAISFIDAQRIKSARLPGS